VVGDQQGRHDTIVGNPGRGALVPKYDAAAAGRCYRRSMKAQSITTSSLALAALLLGACAAGPQQGQQQGMPAPMSFTDQRSSVHRDGDDLLSAGLGLQGLRVPVAPAFADPEQPTAAERRRRALWSNWRGIADLRPGGLGEGYGSLDPVPGREFHA